MRIMDTGVRGEVGPESGGYFDFDDDDDYVNVRSPGFGALKVIVAVVLLVVIGFGGYKVGRSWLASQLNPTGGPGEEVVFVIPSDSTTGDIAKILQAKGVIPNSTFFRYYNRWGYDGAEYQAGEYTMAKNISADAAIAILAEGPREIEYGEFLVPEGLWVSEIVPRIAEQLPNVTEEALWEALNSDTIEARYRPEGIDTWEGLLFPSKYHVEEDITAIEVVDKMHSEFADITGELGYGAADRLQGLSAYEVLIIASLIEAEAKVSQDRAKISRVIHNRLRKGEILGIDASYYYPLQERGVPITQEMIDTPGPYNLRSHIDLPPTPIGAPGKASLEAALNPAEGRWLYYVLADPDGSHAFFENYAEFIEQKKISEAAGLLDG